MTHRLSGTSSHGAYDADMNAVTVEDPRSEVLKALAELAPCETGYPGVAWCQTCGAGQWCADLVERALNQRFPSTDWTPAIREVLGLC